jgi:ATP-dependent DNA helicase RecQ
LRPVPTAEALRTLETVFGLRGFRPGQAEVVEAQLAGQDVLSVAPTGSGKSVSYWIPALLGSGVTVVVSPLISLMKDQVDRLVGLGVQATFVNSSLDRQEQWRRLQLARQGEVRLLYLAPERLARPGFLEVLAGLPVNRFVVDEAHCISTWGHDFRPDYRALGRALDACGRPPVAAFTATATPQVRDDIVQSLGLRDPLVSVTGFNRPNLFLEAVRCSNDAEKLRLLQARLQPGNGRALVYAATVAVTEELARTIASWGFRAAAYHAKLGDDARRRVQEEFSSGGLQVVAATVAFGMGVDISDIRQVFHFHLPSSVESYYQEAGRAGRDGDPATCLLLWRSGDRDLQAFLIERSAEDRLGLLSDAWTEAGDAALAGVEERKRNAYAKLQLSLSYAQLRTCRHARIGDYFGEQGVPRRCEACDNCRREGPAELAVDAQFVKAALACVRRLAGRVGAANVAAVLGGRDTKWVREHEWTKQGPSYGALAEWPQDRIRLLLAELVEAGLAAQSPGEYPVLVLTRAGNEVLEGRTEPDVRLPPVAARASPAGAPGFDPALFEKLRGWRSETARREGIAAYMVFSDRTLQELSARRPADRSALLEVPGVGPAKLAAYADDLLRLLAAGSPI